MSAKGEPATSGTNVPGSLEANSKWRRKWLTARRVALSTAFVTLVSAGVGSGLEFISDRATAGPGVEITVITDPDDVPAFGPPIAMVLPVGTGSPGSGCEGFHGWVTSMGGFDEEETRLQVIVRGLDRGEVVINAMRVHVESRSGPISGTRLLCDTAGEVSQRPLSIDLDAARPSAKLDGADGRPFGFKVANGEVESFLVTARTKKYSVRWRLVLDLVVGGDARTADVAGSGPSFATTAVPAGAPQWVWDFQSSWLGEDGQKVEAGEPFPSTTP